MYLFTKLRVHLLTSPNRKVKKISQRRQVVPLGFSKTLLQRMLLIHYSKLLYQTFTSFQDPK